MAMDDCKARTQLDEEFSTSEKDPDRIKGSEERNKRKSSHNLRPIGRTRGKTEAGKECTAQEKLTVAKDSLEVQRKLAVAINKQNEMLLSTSSHQGWDRDEVAEYICTMRKRVVYDVRNYGKTCQKQ